MREHHRSDDPDVIERELAATRAKVDRTIDQIQERLSPGQLLDEGLRYLRDGPSEYLATFGNNLGHSVRDNPLPVVMIGLGVAWLALGQRTGSTGSGHYRGHHVAHPEREDSFSLADRARAAAARLERGAQESEAAFQHRRQQAMAKILDLREQAGETAAELEDRVNRAMEEASRRWQELKDSVARRGTELREAAADSMAQARDTAARTSDKAFEIFEQQPLLAAAAGVTVGALLGSLLPTAERERAALAPYGETVRREVETVGNQALHAAEEAGRAAAGAAVQAVDRAVDEVAEKVDRASSERHAGRTAHDRELPSPSRPVY